MRLGVFAIAFAVLTPALLAGNLALAPAISVPEAQASVSILMSLDELAGVSDRVVVATARERTSRWEDLDGGRRIVTYTRLEVKRTIFGEEGKDVWVRTLGGVVDKIGQSVAGEAQFTLGEDNYVFLVDIDGVDVVVGRAQGHFRLVQKEGEPVKLAASPDAGTLLPRQGPTISAREVLVGVTLDKAVTETLAARRRQNEKTPE